MVSNAKAITWEEFNRGGGPIPPHREPGRIGRWLRDSAASLLNREFNRIEERQSRDLSVYPALQESKSSLSREFARLNEPGAPGALAAARTILRLGICSPGATLTEVAPRP